MSAILRRLGRAAPAALHRKWLDTLRRPPSPSGQSPETEGSGLAMDGGDGELGPARTRQGLGGGARFVLGPPKH